jgi:hypothetical protein
MERGLRFCLPVVLTFAWLVTMLPCAFAKDITFRGKVIDYETREPIEGAVVVVFWNEATPTIAGTATRLKDVKETLTDNNGEWSIIGEKGIPHTEHPYFYFLTGLYYTKEPEFIIFKPGYCSWPKGFSIDVCKKRMEPGGTGEIMEGKNIELPKLTEREDRRRALVTTISSDSEDPRKGKQVLKKQMNFLRLLNEERRNLGLDEYKIYEELKDDK